MRDRKKAGLFLVFLAAALALGCQQPYPPGAPSQVTVTQTQTVGGPQASPSPGTSTCNPVARVDISAPTRLSVGDIARLDATPRDTAGNPRADVCNLADGVSWGVAGPCALSSVQVYNPTLEAKGAGTCAVSATVAGKTSATESIVVVP